MPIGYKSLSSVHTSISVCLKLLLILQFDSRVRLFKTITLTEKKLLIYW